MDRPEDPTTAALAGPPDARSDAPLGARLEGALVAAQRGDPDAFRLLYRDTQPRLLRYLHALTGDDAEDIASETWLHIPPPRTPLPSPRAGPPQPPPPPPPPPVPATPAAPRPSPSPPKTSPASPPQT